MEIFEIHSNENSYLKIMGCYQTNKIQCCKVWILEMWMLEGILMPHPLVGCYRIRVQRLVRFVWILLSYGITGEGQL